MPLIRIFGLILGVLVFLTFQIGCSTEGVPKTCVSDDICGLGRICENSRCIEGCRKQSDCLEGQICFEKRCGLKICNPGISIACYDGSNKTKNIGICREGTKFCLKDGTAWSACVQQLLPLQETCDLADNDCDGQIDEGLSCECTPGTRRTCYHGSIETLQQGTCRAGIQYCEVDGKWGICHNQVLPATEICDGEDNNCNGQIDEWINCDCQPGESRECYTGLSETANKGTCRKGKQTCDKNNRWGACLGETTPQLEENESCNGKDDDCDGIIDNRSGSKEPLKDFCYEGPRDTLRPNGLCREGIKTCENGKWGSCIGQHLPQQEICNLVDDNCDGQIDEGCQNQCIHGSTRACYPQNIKGCTQLNQSYQCQGECQTGIQVCQNGQWSSCVGSRLPQLEECNQKDDDCDGIIDNDCSKHCTNGDSRSCYDVQQKGCIPPTAPSQSHQCQGECRTGVQICQKNAWGACLFASIPQKELCDGKDNNCDGQIDEDFPLLNQPCMVGRGECTQTAKYVCNSQGNNVFCPAQPTLPNIEICDGKDNDCDGQIDNQCICSPTCSADQICMQGKCVPIAPEPSLEPTPELSPEPVPTDTVFPQETPAELEHDEFPASVDAGPEDLPEPELDPLPEGYICRPGTQQPCYTGSSATLGQGVCQEGMQLCLPTGQWDVCKGDITPTQELCDGKDNDCDGQIDEWPELKNAPLCDNNGKACPGGQTCPQKPGVCTGAKVQCLGVKGWDTQCTAADYQRHSSDYQLVEDRCDNLDNDCDGQIDESCPWALGASSNTNSPGVAIAIDPQRNLYVTGYFWGTLVLGNSTLSTPNSSPQIYVAKVNPAGQFVWAIQAGAVTGDHRPTGIATDSKGDIYLSGYFQDQAIFGGTTLRTVANVTNNRDGFLAKINPQGQFIWTQAFGDAYEDALTAVTVGPNDIVYVAGYFAKYILLGPQKQPFQTTDRGIFFVRLDTFGNFVWVTSGGSGAGANSEDYAYSLATDTQGNLYATGRIGRTSNFGSTTLLATVSRETFITKLDKNQGIFLWALGSFGTGDSVGKSIAIDQKTGNIFVTGSYRGMTTIGSLSLRNATSNIFVARISSQGQIVWANSYGQNNVENSGKYVIVGASGNIIVSGQFGGILDLGANNYRLISKGNLDAFVAGFDGSGSPLWLLGQGGGGNEFANGLTLDPHENIYLVGANVSNLVIGKFSLPGTIPDGRLFLWQILKP